MFHEIFSKDLFNLLQPKPPAQLTSKPSPIHKFNKYYSNANPD